MPKLEQKSPIRKSGAKVTDEVQDGYVYLEKSVTKSQDYQSVKVVVGLTVPINPTKEQLDAAKKTMKIVSEVVDERLTAEIVDLVANNL